MSSLFSDLFNNWSSEEALFKAAWIEYNIEWGEAVVHESTKQDLTNNFSSTNKLHLKKWLWYTFIAQWCAYAWSDLLRGYDVQKDSASALIVPEYCISMELYLAYINKIKNYFDNIEDQEYITSGLKLLDHLVKCRVQLSNQKETEDNMKIYDWVVYFTLRHSRLKNFQKLWIRYIDRLPSDNGIRVTIYKTLKSKS